MNTIEKIVGVDPTAWQIETEFKRRNLALSSFEIIVERVNHNKFTYMVHGFASTESATPEGALMKHMIVNDELSEQVIA